MAGCALPGTAKAFSSTGTLACVVFEIAETWAGPGATYNPSQPRVAVLQNLTVWQHLMDVARIGRMNQFHFFQAAHAIGFLGAKQVPLAGVHPQNFSGRRNLEPLSGAAVRLKFQLLCLFRHEPILAQIFCGFLLLTLSLAAIRFS